MIEIDAVKTVREGVLLWARIGKGRNAKWKREKWVPCRAFADQIGRPYTTVLAMMRQKKIPAAEIGTGRYYVCITPLGRAKLAYRALQRAGLTHPRV